MPRWLESLLTSLHVINRGNADEERLISEVHHERVHFESRRRRADKVLRDFHAADAVVKGRTGGNRGS